MFLTDTEYQSDLYSIVIDLKGRWTKDFREMISEAKGVSTVQELHLRLYWHLCIRKRVVIKPEITDTFTLKCKMTHSVY